MLRKEYKAMRLYDMECREKVIRSSEEDRSYQKFMIPKVDSWQVRLIVNE
jgi:hypothetical protein